MFLNDHKYYEQGYDWDNYIILKTDEEMEMFKAYLQEFVDKKATLIKLHKSRGEEISRDLKKPVYVIAETDIHGWNKAFTDYNIEKLRSKFAQLRRKRGMFHKWTVEDIMKAEKRLKQLLDEMDYDHIDDREIKNVCHHINKAADWIDEFMKQQGEG